MPLSGIAARCAFPRDLTKGSPFIEPEKLIRPKPALALKA
jgi:hypothetical protein